MLQASSCSTVSASTNRPKPATQKEPNNEGLGGESSVWNDEEDWGAINDPPADKPKVCLVFSPFYYQRPPLLLLTP